MGLRCYEGAMASCASDATRTFGGVVPANILRYEAEVLAAHFGATLAAWEREDAYHSYYNVSTLCSARIAERAWREYARDPAPVLNGPRDEPVRTGDRSFAMTFLDGWRPLPGGWVTHYVDARSRAIANATNTLHVLHPGHIVRWLAVSGHVLTSNTLGRGIGWMPRTNESFGVQIFQELDERIRERLR